MLEPVSRWWGVALGGQREGCEPLGCAGKYQDLGPQSVLTAIQAAPVWEGWSSSADQYGLGDWRELGRAMGAAVLDLRMED